MSNTYGDACTICLFDSCSIVKKEVVFDLTLFKIECKLFNRFTFICERVVIDNFVKLNGKILSSLLSPSNTYQKVLMYDSDSINVFIVAQYDLLDISTLFKKILSSQERDSFLYYFSHNPTVLSLL